MRPVLRLDSSVASFTEALGELGLGEARHVYWAGHAVFVRRPEHSPRYARAFAAFWSGATPSLPRPAPVLVPAELVTDIDDVPASLGDDRTAPAPGAGVVRYSAIETLHDKDFAACTPAELAEAYELIARLRTAPARRPSQGARAPWRDRRDHRWPPKPTRSPPVARRALHLR